ncbi:MAG: TIGR01777 family oxidoreductase [Negativicutes bacterium]
MNKILVVGGTGFVGKALVNHLRANGYDPITLSRSGIMLPDKVIRFDSDGLVPVDVLSDFYGIVNLAGENISQRWTSSVKTGILSSRLETTNRITAALRRNRQAGLPLPSVLVNASAVGYYGVRPLGIQTEDSPSGEGYLASVCRQWEQAATAAVEDGVRVVVFRFGLVLGHGGGILAEIEKPFQFRIGGVIGSGEQHMSWVHNKDLVRAIQLALDRAEMQGPYNLTSPYPVSMAEFTRCVGKELGRRSWTKVPAFIAKIIFGEMAEELLLADQQVAPKRLLEQGFTFSFPEISAAVADIYKNVSTTH